ncbi:MAG: trigger factor [Acetatifactor sp.]|nr:trigger factor [Acetatifactor sp.]MDE6699850.1 trigger factor [Acetatifactor sp.]
MKKRWIGVLALAMSAALLCGCGDKGKKGSSDSESLSAGGIQASEYVTLGEYKGLEIDVMPAEQYDDEEIEIQTKQFYFNYVQEEEGITDRPVELLDMTNIDYEGKKDGVAFEGGTAQGALLLIGSGQFIPGFEEGLVGVMPGETVDLPLTFPEAYGNSDLAGQEVVFTVTVNFIPEMEDAKVEGIGVPDVKTVDQLRQYVKNALDSRAQSEYLSAAGDAVLARLVENCEFAELPADMLQKNRESYASWLDQMAASYGMDAESYVTMYGLDYESTLDGYAEQYTKEILIMQVIAEREGMNLSDEELDARLEAYAKTSNITVDELLVNGLTKEEYRESFLYEDVLNWLVENAVNTAE